MNYTKQITITVPATFAAIASAIGRALDPDRGGADSFQPVEGTENIAVTTPCTEEFAQQVPVMLENPSVLFNVVQADYATRWKDFTPPTLAECTEFCNAVIPKPKPVIPTLP